MTDKPIGKLVRLAKLSAAFTPAAPVGGADFLAGRTDQIMTCVTSIFQRGLHIVVYGERGVGKTSLANVLPEIIAAVELPGLAAVRVDCNSSDSFSSLWNKIFRELRAEWLDEDGPIDPESVRFRLAKDDGIRLIVIDELDRIIDKETFSLLADTLKTLSDHAVNVTLMLVGVANSLEQLLGEHQSIVRCVAQVDMPRMSPPELEKILDKGYGHAGMTIEAEANELVVGLAEGLPHFVHLLGLESGMFAAQDDRTEVVVRDVDRALKRVTATHTVTSEFRRATQSPQSGHLFEEVLLACALVPKDSLGYFRAADVVAPLSQILGRQIAIPNFARHLNELSGEERGAVLIKDGKPHNYRYRFRNPMLQPFAKMVALSSGMASPEFVRSFAPAIPPQTMELNWLNDAE